MKKIDFNSLNDEELRFFQTKFIEAFEKVLNNLREHKFFCEENMKNGGKTISDLNLSAFGKLALLAKKVFINAAIYGATGIEPKFLDNDTSFLRKNDNDRKEYYMRCSLKKLIYTIVNDLYKGLEELIRRLKTDNKEDLIKVLSTVDEFERENFDFEEKHGVKGEKLSYELMLYPLLSIRFIFLLLSIYILISLIVVWLWPKGVTS